MLEEEGFYSGSEKALIEELGLQSEGLIDEMNRSVPFGDRRRRPARLSSKLVLMANEERPVCASRFVGSGMAVLVLGIQPTVNVRDEHGAIMIFILGFGSCANSVEASTKRYTEGLSDEAKAQILEVLASSD